MSFLTSAFTALNFPLSTLLPICKFWYIVVFIAFILEYFLVSPVIALLAHWLFRSFYCLNLTYLWISWIPFSYRFLISFHCVWKTLYDFSHFEYIEACFIPNMWSILKNVPCALGENMSSAIVGWSALLMSVTSGWLIVFFTSFLPLHVI